MDDKKTNAIKDLVSTLGFPVVVCGWLLYERWTLIAQLTNTINQNSEMIRQLTEKIGG